MQYNIYFQRLLSYVKCNKCIIILTNKYHTKLHVFVVDNNYTSTEIRYTYYHDDNRPLSERKSLLSCNVIMFGIGRTVYSVSS